MAPEKLERAAKLHAMATMGEEHEAKIAATRRDELLAKEGVSLEEFQRMLDANGAPRMGRPGPGSRQGPPFGGFGGFQWSSYTGGSTSGWRNEGMDVEDVLKQMADAARRQQEEHAENLRRRREQRRRDMRAPFGLSPEQEELLEETVKTYRGNQTPPRVVKVLINLLREMNTIHDGAQKIIDAIDSGQEIDTRKAIRALAVSQRATSMAVLRILTMQAIYAGSGEMSDDATTFGQLFDVD